MKIKNGLLSFLPATIALIIVLSHSGCANIVPPSGGPRDTLPPVLMSALPDNVSYHFKANKIVLTFDEFIDAKDLSTNLFVNPVPKIAPIVDAKLRTLTIRIKDTLQPNTTYSLDFGKAIRDVNEANILRNFTYLFSTGSYIDSMEFTGNVILAATGKIDTGMIVLLHRKLDDSAVVKDRPRYVVRVDSTGYFHFRYIEPGTYALYAMKDEGGTRKYLSKGQLFAFAEAPVVISGRNTKPVTLYAYSEKLETKTKSTTGNKPANAKPSAKEKLKEKDKRLQFTTNIANNVFDVLDTLHLTFPNGLRVFDSSKVSFVDENFHDIAPKDYHFLPDSAHKIFWLFYAWPTDTKFHLIFAKDFALDSAGRKLLKIDTITFHTKRDIDYGEVRIRITNLNLNKNPVLQFIQQDAVKFSYPFGKVRQFKVQLFPPGDYELRILYDDNRNGIWDAGEFFGKHLQPEKIVPIRKKFTVKANWDNDLDITL